MGKPKEGGGNRDDICSIYEDGLRKARMVSEMVLGGSLRKRRCSC